MSLIKSISGIRGTIGGKAGENLTPPDIIKYTASYATFIQKSQGKKNITIILARDARISGPMAEQLMAGTLTAMGAKVISIGQATTPTAEIAVTELKADGGIIITASHNPKQWNAMKLLNAKGEFLDAKEGAEILDLAENRFQEIGFAQTDDLQAPETNTEMLNRHIELVLASQYVDVDAIKNANFTVAVDGVNSVGGPAIIALLKALGVSRRLELFCQPTGEFPHNPEPLPENLSEISALIKKKGADIGFVTDPDGDRLAVIAEDGNVFGEEYTLAAAADYVLSVTPGDAVSNLSSSRVLRDIAEKHGGKYTASAVGEVNVVAEMKRVNAVIGGEGNGGVILPELHYGRDALIGVAIILTLLAKGNIKSSELRASYPNYFIVKNKIQLTPTTDVDAVLLKIKNEFKDNPDAVITDIDGVKLDFEEGWVHLRKSNTEPIIRVYAESKSEQKAQDLALLIMKLV